MGTAAGRSKLLNQGPEQGLNLITIYAKRKE